MTTTTPTHPDRIRSDTLAHAAARPHVERPRSAVAAAVFNVLDPVPYGFFVGALIADVVYASTAEVMWFKGAAWLIAAGLLFAVLPRFINLARVWFPGGRGRAPGAMVGFWLNLAAIAAAIVNAFVHSRDAYAVMPEGLWLSVLTVALLVLAKVIPTLQRSNERVS